MTTGWLILAETVLLWVMAFALAWAGIQLVLKVVVGSERVPLNYRGAPVPPVLGFVWLFWLIGERLFQPIAAGLGDLLFNVLGVAVENASGIVPLFDRSDTFFVRAAALAVAVVLVGLVDDVWGDGEARGIRGHVAALSRGRPSTGAVKVLGIGLLAVVAASEASQPLWGTHGSSLWRPADLLGWIFATGLIAGMANLVNLMDLRPGRALKSYGLASLIVAVLLSLTSPTWPSADPIERFMAAAGVLVFALAPLLAVWRLDTRERAMLGDAGANAFGFVAGVMLVMALPGWGTAIAFVIVLALNLLSERISFSEAIERNAVLRWVDLLGRRGTAPSHEVAEKTDER